MLLHHILLFLKFLDSVVQLYHLLVQLGVLLLKASKLIKVLVLTQSSFKRFDFVVGFHCEVLILLALLTFSRVLETRIFHDFIHDSLFDLCDFIVS